MDRFCAWWGFGSNDDAVVEAQDEFSTGSLVEAHAWTDHIAEVLSVTDPDGGWIVGVDEGDGRLWSIALCRDDGGELGYQVTVHRQPGREDAHEQTGDVGGA